MKIKQINNMTIHKTNESQFEFYVKTPDGRILEEYTTLAEAESFARETKDFTKRR